MLVRLFDYFVISARLCDNYILLLQITFKLAFQNIRMVGKNGGPIKIGAFTNKKNGGPNLAPPFFWPPFYFWPPKNGPPFSKMGGQ